MFDCMPCWILLGFFWSLLARVFRRNREEEGERSTMMDARAQPVAEGEVKQRNARNRSVLQDTDNLLFDGGDQGKKKAVAGRGVTRAAAATKKEVEKNKPHEVSSDDESENKPAAKPVTKRVTRKGVKTVTAILTARSKAACGIKNRPQTLVADIDTADVNNHLAVVEYVDDLYNYYKLAEVDSIVHDYMETQPEATAMMRAIVVDWLIDVHWKFKLMPETLYLTLNIVDRFLAMKVVARRELQLVGMSAMLIACKYEETWAPQVNDFVSISDRAYTGEQVLLMEKIILQRLEWYLTFPTPYVFLVRYIKASLPSPDTMMEHMSFYLAELGLVRYSVAVFHSPSVIAASAVYAARCTLNRTPFMDLSPSSRFRRNTLVSSDEMKPRRTQQGIPSNITSATQIQDPKVPRRNEFC